MTIYGDWPRMHVRNADHVLKRITLHQPEIGGWDTETTGLHLKRDRPFLIVVGFLYKGADQGEVYTFEPSEHNMNLFFKIANMFKVFVAHNVKYDLHMIANLTGEERVERMKNLTDTMIMARLTFQAVSAREGGDSLALKDIGVKYIHPDAGASEKAIKAVKERLKKQRVSVLAAALKQFPLVLDGEQQYTATGRPQNWGMGAVESFLKDITNSVEDLPDDVREVWESYPIEEPTYFDIYNEDREAMIEYAQDDVITMLKFYLRCEPIIRKRKQVDVWRRENRVIMPLFRMERVGLPVDQNLLERRRQGLQDYIKLKRAELKEAAGENINANQHKRIKDWLEAKLDREIESTDKGALKKLKEFPAVRRFVSLIIELRTLEKWYSTYILRIQNAADYDGRFYTQIGQANAISGRVGSDSQQFPKKGLYADDGTLLFHPREVFVVDKGMRWYLLDFSQIELRVQANYTILLGYPDLNMCRAYMPYKCVSENGDYFNASPLQRFNALKWYFEEDRSREWHPTDVHAETTRNALRFLGYALEGENMVAVKEDVPFGDVIDKEKFAELRGSLGKRYNFSKNYGIGLQATMDNLDVSAEVAEALSSGYSESFPGVLYYQQMIQDVHLKRGYVHNLYGRRYYLEGIGGSYKLANYAIQGTCADDLKECIIKVDQLLDGKQSKFVMNVHDELSFFIAPEEEYLVKEIKAVMEEPRSWMHVPIVADVEVTDTSWMEKREVTV